MKWVGLISGLLAVAGTLACWDGGAPGALAANRLQPSDFSYQGAFRLPDEFSWGARGMSYYPAGAGGTGSLLVTGFEALSDGSGEVCYQGADCRAYYAEVAIPTPVSAANWEDLPPATFLRQMTVFDGALIQETGAYSMVTGIEYVPARGSQTTDKIYGSWDAWYPEGDFGDNSFPTVWFNEFDGTNARGLYHVGPTTDPLFHGRKMGDYLFSVPQPYADQYLGGRTLVTGRARGTAISGAPGVDGEGATAGGSQGPTLIAFRAWDSENPTGNLDALPVLYYRVRYPGCAGPDVGVGGQPVNCDYPGYSMCDAWTGASFVESNAGSAVVILGWKGTTNCYYCGDPVDDSQCTVDPLGGECDLMCNESRGYHCGPYERQVLFYDTTELGQSALGSRAPWSVLPYTIWRPTQFYLQGQTCHNSGGVSFDRAGRRLFMIERGLGEGGMNAGVVHVWEVSGQTVPVTSWDVLILVLLGAALLVVAARKTMERKAVLASPHGIVTADRVPLGKGIWANVRLKVLRAKAGCHDRRR